MGIWYALPAQYGYEELVRIYLEDDISSSTMYPLSDSSPLIDPHLSVRCTAKRGEEEVVVNLELDIEHYALRLQVNNDSWYPIAETPDALRLRVRLLRYIHAIWRSPENTEPISPDAHRILRNSAEEILRIQQK